MSFLLSKLLLWFPLDTAARYVFSRISLFCVPSQNYIIKNKSNYSRLLQQILYKETLEEWQLFMINGIQVTSWETIELYKFYSQHLLNYLFKHLYTKIEFVVNDLKVSRITTANFLNKLAEESLLKKARNSKKLVIC